MRSLKAFLVRELIIRNNRAQLIRITFSKNPFPPFLYRVLVSHLSFIHTMISRHNLLTKFARSTPLLKSSSRSIHVSERRSSLRRSHKNGEKSARGKRTTSGGGLRAGKYLVRVGCKKHDASLRQSHIRGQARGNRKLTLTSSPCHTYFVAAAVFMVWLVSDFERERERE